MSASARLNLVFPTLAKAPGTLGWRMAPLVGRESRAAERPTLDYLAQIFGQAFPASDPSERSRWARAHLDMLALEQLDAMALHRLGVRGGPQIDLDGWQHVEALRAAGQGFVLVLNHFDRLLAGLIALARRGLTIHTLSMPVADNAELSPAQRAYLTRKVSRFVGIAGGSWRTSDEPMRPVYDGLRAGQVWTILADAWRPEFTRLRDHPFLGGLLQLPTGIERIAQASGVPLLHVTTFTEQPDRLRVRVQRLPANAREAIDEVVRTLEQDVRVRPWAWWQWGQWNRMWRPFPQSEGQPQGDDV